MQRSLAWLGVGILSALALSGSLTALAAQSQVAHAQLTRQLNERSIVRSIERSPERSIDRLQDQVAELSQDRSILMSQLPSTPSASPRSGGNLGTTPGSLSDPVLAPSGLDGLPSLNPPQSLPSLTEPTPHRGGRWRSRSRSTPHSPATPEAPRIFSEPEGNTVEPMPPSDSPEGFGLDSPRSPTPRFNPRRFQPENPVVLGSGSFTSTGHLIQGRVTLVTARGKSTLRFSPSFMTDGAANSQIAVVLHREAAPRNLENPDDYVTIGDLRQFNGAHDYGIPPTIDPTEYRSIVIWNPRSRVTYGYASLQ